MTKRQTQELKQWSELVAIVTSTTEAIEPPTDWYQDVALMSVIVSDLRNRNDQLLDRIATMEQSLASLKFQLLDMLRSERWLDDDRTGDGETQTQEEEDERSQAE